MNSHFSQNRHLIVGNVQHVEFWKDRWLENATLKGEFPASFQIAREPDSATLSKWKLLESNFQKEFARLGNRGFAQNLTSS